MAYKLSNLCFHILLLFIWCFQCSDITCYFPYVCNLFLMDIFTGNKILGWQFFSLSIWKILCNIFPAYSFSDEKYTVIQIVFLLYLWCHFSLAALTIYSLSYIFRSLTIICPSVDFFGFILFGACSAWFYRLMSFAKFGNFLACPFLLSIQVSDYVNVISFVVILEACFSLFYLCCWY